MSKVRMLRALVKQRLTAAAEEIFGLFEATIAEYEEELCRSKEENERQRERMDAVFIATGQRLYSDLYVAPSKEVKAVAGGGGDGGARLRSCSDGSRYSRRLNNSGRTSVVWQYFKSKEGDSSRATCSICNADFSRGGKDPKQHTTSPLLRHLRIKHPKEYELFMKDSTDTSQNAATSVLPADVERVLVDKQEVPPEQQEWSSSVDQEDTKHPPHIKEEQEELWSSQEGEQLQGLGEADIKVLFTPVPVKSEEDDGEEAQSSQLHQRQTEHMETEADGEDCGGAEPDRNAHPDYILQPAAHDQALHSKHEAADKSGDWDETEERQPGLNPLQNGDVAVRDSRCSAAKKKFSCSECGKRFSKKKHLEDHIRIHTGEKPFSCSVCKSSFKQSGGLHAHMKIHTGEKTISCSVCKKCFKRRESLKTHMIIHTREKKFSCSVCKKCFKRRESLTAHVRIHTGEKPLFCCSLCDKGYMCRSSLKSHMITHTGETPFSCSVCEKSFAWSGLLQRHMQIHTEDPPFSCSECGKGFFCKSNMKKHMRTHTGEKPFSCSVCKKCFTQNGSLKTHMKIHTREREKPFACSVCEKFYSNKRYLRTHMRIHTGEKPYSCSECDERFSYREALVRHMRTHTEETPAAEGGDCGGPEPARNSDPDGLEGPDTEDETGDSSRVATTMENLAWMPAELSPAHNI
ncbi:zinc finger protein 79-like [Perca fluviatilis]|uniref:zinc finger protein 79-like n=1 Tax=Perca fluviatilis TaxID=8168 RepID=UPI0019646169|nr:zinc finger protein 79-like [Perca fluviatilis]